MKVGDKVALTVKWKQALCKSSRIYKYTPNTHLVLYGNAVGVVIHFNEIAQFLLVKWPDSKVGSYHKSNMKVVRLVK